MQIPPFLHRSRVSGRPVGSLFKGRVSEGRLRDQAWREN